MGKTKEELEQLRQEYKALTEKFKELSEDELKEVTGGDSTFVISGQENDPLYNPHMYKNTVKDKDEFLQK